MPDRAMYRHMRTGIRRKKEQMTKQEVDNQMTQMAYTIEKSKSTLRQELQEHMGRRARKAMIEFIESIPNEKLEDIPPLTRTLYEGKNFRLSCKGTDTATGDTMISILINPEVLVMSTTEKGMPGGAFGDFPAGRKCENPDTPTQSSVRTNAILTCHPAPAPGQTHFPRPKSHLSLLYTTYEEVVDVVFIPAAGEGVEPLGADTVTGDTMIQILITPEVYVSTGFSDELVDVDLIPAAGERVEPLGADALRDMLIAAMKC
ncbi:hypothetical protein MMC22_001686 [Lobaria immixta]|nr:hypothetical protein [Lobaria immixta]